jgi:hypothetical protein
MRGSSLLQNQRPTRLCSAIVGGRSLYGKIEDQDRGKGAMEEDKQSQGGNTSMQGQLGHRDEDVGLKNADSNLAG